MSQLEGYLRTGDAEHHIRHIGKLCVGWGSTGERADTFRCLRAPSIDGSAPTVSRAELIDLLVDVAGYWKARPYDLRPIYRHIKLALAWVEDQTPDDLFRLDGTGDPGVWGPEPTFDLGWPARKAAGDRFGF